VTSFATNVALAVGNTPLIKASSRLGGNRLHDPGQGQSSPIRAVDQGTAAALYIIEDARRRGQAARRGTIVKERPATPARADGDRNGARHSARSS